MSLRFRRSIKLASGVRVNFGLRGTSVSVGGKGATVTVGCRGTHVNIGIPGTGISYRSKLSSSATQSSIREQQRNHREPERKENLLRKQQAFSKVTLKMNEDGTLDAENAFNESLNRANMNLLWEQKGAFVKEWLEDKVAEINNEIESFINIHLHTPYPESEPEYVICTFHEPEPQQPISPDIIPIPYRGIPPKLGWFAGFFANKRVKYEDNLKQFEDAYATSVALWEKQTYQQQKNYEQIHDDW